MPYNGCSIYHAFDLIHFPSFLLGSPWENCIILTWLRGDTNCEYNNHSFSTDLNESLSVCPLTSGRPLWIITMPTAAFTISVFHENITQHSPRCSLESIVKLLLWISCTWRLIRYDAYICETKHISTHVRWSVQFERIFIRGEGANWFYYIDSEWTNNFFIFFKWTHTANSNLLKEKRNIWNKSNGWQTEIVRSQVKCVHSIYLINFYSFWLNIPLA